MQTIKLSKDQKELIANRLITNNWKDLLESGFTQGAISEFFSPDSLNWTLIEDYYNGDYTEVIPQVKTALKTKIKLLRSDYLKAIKTLKKEYINR